MVVVMVVCSVCKYKEEGPVLSAASIFLGPVTSQDMKYIDFYLS